MQVEEETEGRAEAAVWNKVGCYVGGGVGGGGMVGGVVSKSNQRTFESRTYIRYGQFDLGEIYYFQKSLFREKSL